MQLGDSTTHVAERFSLSDEHRNREKINNLIESIHLTDTLITHKFERPN